MSPQRGERIPVYRPLVTAEDARAVEAAASDGWVSGASPRVAELEERFAAYCGARHGAATCSGTVALEIALTALGVGPGDEVICPCLTIISCARAIVNVGAAPVFVDVDPQTWTLDVDAALARVGPRTRAVLAVHLFGWPVDLSPLLPLRERGVFIVEDAAQAIGSEVRVADEWRRCGGVGDLATFSFYANKTITTGEGGMVVGAERHHVQRARRAASLFFGDEERFRHDELGFGARINGLGAALGLSQLSRIDALTERKREIAATYREALDAVEGVGMAETPAWARPVPWMVAVAVEKEAKEVIAGLEARGVEARPFFVGMHRQPALVSRGVSSGGTFEVTDDLSARGLYLPSSLSITDEEIRRVVDALGDALRAAPSRQRGDGSCFGAEYARRYDAIYADKPYAAEARKIHEVLTREGGTPLARVLDLGCGTGRHARALTDLGLGVRGVDRSKAMIAEARRRCGDSVELFVQEIGALDLGSEIHDAALMLFTVMGYLGDDDEIVTALSRVRQHLRGGALLIADVWDRAAVLSEPPANGDARFEGESGGFVREVGAEHLPEEDRVDVRYRIRRTDGTTVCDELHAVRYFDEETLRALLGRAGFELTRFEAWPDLRGDDGRRDYTAYLVARAV